MDFSSTVPIDWHQVLFYHSLFVFNIYLTKKCFRLNTSFFLHLGLQKRVIEMTVLEYLKIQLHLNLTSQVSIVSLFSKDEDKETNMRSIIRNKCLRDGFIVYEKGVVITKLGMKQFIIHMYGLQSWIKAKINNMKIVL